MMSENEMRRLTRRQMLKFAGGVGAVAALAACSPAAPAPAPAEPAQPAAEQPAAEEPAAAEQPAAAKTSIRLWSHQNTAFVTANEALVKMYMEQHPEVEIKYENFPYADFIQTIQTSMAAKNEADVMEMFGSWVPAYTKGGTLSEAPADVMTYAQAQDLFYAAPLDGYQRDGKLYGFPNEYNLENGAVLTNKRMFEEDSLKHPPEWESWDALTADAAKLARWNGDVMERAGYHYVTGDGLGFLLWQGILERGSDYFASDGVHFNLETDEAEATVQWLQDMALVHKVVDATTFNGDSNWVGDSFFQGLVAIGFIGPWIVPVARTNFPDFQDPWEYVPAPYYGDQMSFAADAGWGKVVSPNTVSLPISWDYARFAAVEAANAKQWNIGTGTVPALKSVAADPTLLDDLDWLGPSLAVLEFGRFVGDLQDRDYVWYTVVQARLTETLQGQHTPSEAVALMNQEINAMIDSKIGA
jgi:multiple sugar transport system substrate-binding protein